MKKLFLLMFCLTLIASLVLVMWKREKQTSIYSPRDINYHASIPKRVSLAQPILIPKKMETPKKKEEHLDLHNRHLDLKVRLKIIRELPLEKDITLPAQQLLELVLSDIPLSKTVDPHSTIAYEYQREAALRVYALRRLTEELSLKNFIRVVMRIERESPDLALSHIARQAFNAKKRGGNYFEEMTAGIRSAPLPH